MSWRVSDKDGLLVRSGDDPFVRCEVAADGVGLAGPLGWAVLSPAERDRAGAVVVLDVEPDEARGRDLVRRLTSLAQDEGRRLAWIVTEGGIELPLGEPWQFGAHWVWMSATTVSSQPENSWSLIELDDDSDAEEIAAFAVPINPLFEGDPGQGRTRLWLGARDTSGALIACGAVHETPAGVGHLAGLVVAPQYRRKGLGRAIVLGLSRAVLASDGVVTLSAYADNEAAIRLYLGLGYRLDHAFVSRFREPRRAASGQ